jgi:hypothetical protein
MGQLTPQPGESSTTLCLGPTPIVAAMAATLLVLAGSIVPAAFAEDCLEHVGQWAPGPASVRAVETSGDYVYVTHGVDGLHVIYAGDPAAPVEVEHYETFAEPTGLAIADGYAYVADGEQGLRVIGVGSPLAWAGAYDSPGQVTDVAASDRYAFVTSEDGHLWTMDVSQPSDPLGVGSCEISGPTTSMATADGSVYVTNREGLQVVDARDPSAPAVVSFIETPGDALDVAVSRSLAFVADSSSVRIIDVESPSTPLEVGSWKTPGHATGIAVSGDWAYVAAGSAGLCVLNVSSPSAPWEEGFLDLPGEAYDVVAAGGTGHRYAYVVTDDGLFRVIDVSTPSSLGVIGSSRLLETSRYDIAVSGHYAYLANGAGSIAVIDISAPSSPADVTSYSTRGGALGVAAVGATACTSLTDSAAWRYSEAAFPALWRGRAWRSSSDGEVICVAEASAGTSPTRGAAATTAAPPTRQCSDGWPDRERGWGRRRYRRSGMSRWLTVRVVRGLASRPPRRRGAGA